MSQGFGKQQKNKKIYTNPHEAEINCLFFIFMLVYFQVNRGILHCMTGMEIKVQIGSRMHQAITVISLGVTVMFECTYINTYSQSL